LCQESNYIVITFIVPTRLGDK